MAELGLAIIGTIDLCIHWGDKLVDLCTSYQHANEEIASRSLRLEAGWLKTGKQLHFLKHISHELDEYHRSINLRTTEQLHSHLKIARGKISSVSQMTEEQQNDRFRRFRRELDRWHATADPMWYLVLRMPNAVIDQALARQETNAAKNFPSALKIRDARRQSESNNQLGQSVFLDPKELESLFIYDVPLCTSKMAQRISTGGAAQNLILTTLQCPQGARVDLVMKDVRELATKLAINDPKTFGLLSCKGVIKQDIYKEWGQSITSFTMVFRSPGNQFNMSSLRSKLIAKDTSVTLGDRFNFARQLAKSVAYIHTFGFVHKSIRPENILLFQSSSTPSAYLAGFENFRREDARTYRHGVFEWEKNLYAHPSRQGLNPREDYVMQHDIYSLGVCLLEIGLWESFVIYDEDGKCPVVSSLLDEFARECQERRSHISASKDWLVKISRENLPRFMGHKYYEVVETCLTCLDPENVNFGDEQELMDNDGIVVGVRYVEKILSCLNEITV